MTFKRNIPATVRAQIEREENDNALLVFIDIKHPDLNEPIRVVGDPENFVLGGALYIGFDFRIELLSDNDTPPVARLSIQNVDRRIADTLLRTVNPPRIELQIVAASEFDVTVIPRTELGTAQRVYRAQHLYLTDVSGDKLQVSGTLRSFDYTQKTWPALRATKARYPRLYW